MLNSKHTHEQQIKTLEHELSHIKRNDLVTVIDNVNILEAERHKALTY